MYKLHLKDREQKAHIIFYDPHTSSMKWENGVDIVNKDSKEVIWERVKSVSKENPGKKAKNVSRLKIQLGLGCNYSCSYCLQSAEIHKASASSTKDAQNFIDTLDLWLEGTPQKIEFWGGEPLLYWNKLKVLVPALKKKFPEAKLSTITNGTLLSQEIVDTLYDWEFSLAISHDGPGQELRGDDPLEIPEQRAMIEYCMSKFIPNNRFSFNAVLTNKSYDLKKITEWFHEKYPNVVVSFEGVVHDYSGSNESRFTDNQLKDLSTNLALQLIYGELQNSPLIQIKILDFLQSLALRRPSYALNQKCSMDREDQLAVDLLGNVMTCQNVGAKGEHKIGHVRSFDKINLTTATHWANKEECKNCPVLQLCKGSCMYLEGEQWNASCNAEFAFNKGIFAGALFLLTGMVLENIEGHIVRPVNPMRSI